MLPLADLVARYLRYREIGKKLNSVFLEQLPKDGVNEGSRDLGLLRKGTLVFDSEDEMAVLMDYCIHHVLRQGRNVVQSLLERNPPPEGSDELFVLQAMAEAWYSIFVVSEVEPGTGVHVQDILRETKHFLIDVNMSRTALPGALFASQVVPFDGFIMTTGAALPLSGGIARRDKLTAQVTEVIFQNNIVAFDQMTPQQEQELCRTIIRTALSWGASSQIRFEDPDRPVVHSRDPSMPRDRLVPVQTGGRVGRNEPCPCGSGKEFKRCCAR